MSLRSLLTGSDVIKDQENLHLSVQGNSFVKDVTYYLQVIWWRGRGGGGRTTIPFWGL